MIGRLIQPEILLSSRFLNYNNNSNSINSINSFRTAHNNKSSIANKSSMTYIPHSKSLQIHMGSLGSTIVNLINISSSFSQ